MRAIEPPYTQAELEEKLDDILYAALSSRRSVAVVAAGVATLTRSQQDFVLSWAQVAVQNVAELGYQFTAQAPQAFALFGQAQVEKWIRNALDAYDREGLYSACATLKDLTGFKRRVEASGEGVALAAVTRVLELFLRGLSGRELRLEPSPDTWTDTATIFLPEHVNAYATRADNFRLYKALAVHHWAQARFGSFNADLNAAIGAYGVPQQALDWLNFLEANRLESHVRRGFPGLGTLLASLRPALPDTLAGRLARLSLPESTVTDSIALLPYVYSRPLPEPYAWMGSLRPAEAARVREERIVKERRALYAELAQLRESLQPESPGQLAAGAQIEAESSFETLDFKLEIEGEPIAPPENVAKLMRSIIQDFGEIPEEYLLASGPGAYLSVATPEADPAAAESAAVGGKFYDEWDFRRRDYRKDWCVLFDHDVPAGDSGVVARFFDEVRVKYAGQISLLKRRFEALRGEDRLLRRQSEGDDIDFDAVVEAYADRAVGLEPSERLFAKRRRVERNIAVMFMVDMSGSTKGWINDCEREALVMLCEALEALGDRYAIYGFSGWTRKRCEIYRVKTFAEPYAEAVRARIAGVEPKDYTRMGVAIRHLSGLLNAVEAKTRILFTLSDGKPDDFSDGYRGAYGIEDTRQALIEARQSGIHPFCVTIDEQARDYLPHMYGQASWILIDDVRKLPLKAAEVYRRLTA